MMSQAIKFGELACTKVYCFYDCPRIFIAQDKPSGQLFLAYWLDEVHEADQYVYAPINEQEFQAIEAMGVVQDILGERKVFLVDLPYRTDNEVVREIDLSSVVGELMPEGLVLNNPEED